MELCNRYMFTVYIYSFFRASSIKEQFSLLLYLENRINQIKMKLRYVLNFDILHSKVSQKKRYDDNLIMQELKKFFIERFRWGDTLFYHNSWFFVHIYCIFRYIFCQFSIHVDPIVESCPRLNPNGTLRSQCNMLQLN